jgi:hypothetical protein
VQNLRPGRTPREPTRRKSIAFPLPVRFNQEAGKKHAFPFAARAGRPENPPKSSRTSQNQNRDFPGSAHGKFRREKVKVGGCLGHSGEWAHNFYTRSRGAVPAEKGNLARPIDLQGLGFWRKGHPLEVHPGSTGSPGTPGPFPQVKATPKTTSLDFIPNGFLVNPWAWRALQRPWP